MTGRCSLVCCACTQQAAATATFGTQVEEGDVAMEGDDELHLEDSYVLRERRISNAALNLLDVSQEDYAEFTPRWSNDGNDWLVEDGVHRLQPDDIGARLSLALRPWLLQSSRPLSVCWHACQKEEGGFSTRA